MSSKKSLHLAYSRTKMALMKRVKLGIFSTVSSSRRSLVCYSYVPGILAGRRFNVDSLVICRTKIES